MVGFAVRFVVRVESSNLTGWRQTLFPLMRFFRQRAKLVRYDDKLSEADVKDAFCSISPGNPFWQALDHVIDQTLLDAIDDVSDPKNAEKPGSLAHAAGGVDKLSTLKSKIQNLRILDNLG